MAKKLRERDLEERAPGWRVLNQDSNGPFAYTKELGYGFSLGVMRDSPNGELWRGYIRPPGPVNDIRTGVMDACLPAQIATERWAKAYFIRLAALIYWPECFFCANPATCLGAYEGNKEGYACDDCCGHGCEDGYCATLEEV